MFEHVIAPLTSNAEPFVELARVRSGKIYRKHILNRGPLRHPATGAVINIDDSFINSLKKNFDAKICDIVPFQLAGPNNEHTESVLATAGEVLGLEENEGKVYAVIDVRDEDVATRLSNRTILGASAMLSLDYTNTSNGVKSGPCLLHVAACARPFITNLEDYKEIVAASAPALDDVALLEPQDQLQDETTDKLEEGAPASGSQEGDPVSEEQEIMTLEEMLADLKTNHNIDVEALTAQAKTVDDAQAAAKEATDKNAALSASLTEALKGTDVVKLSSTKDEEITADDIVGAVAELAENNVQLTSRVDSLAKESAGTYVDKLVGDGFVLPAQRDTFVELRLTNTDLFDKLIPEKPIIALSNEKGTEGDADVKKELDVDAEIARLTAPGGAAAQYVTQAN